MVTAQDRIGDGLLQLVALDHAGVVGEMDRRDILGEEQFGRHAQENAVNEKLAERDVADQREDKVDDGAEPHRLGSGRDGLLRNLGRGHEGGAGRRGGEGRR